MLRNKDGDLLGVGGSARTAASGAGEDGDGAQGDVGECKNWLLKA